WHAHRVPEHGHRRVAERRDPLPGGQWLLVVQARRHGHWIRSRDSLAQKRLARRVKGHPMIRAVLCLALTPCGVSALSDAQADCYRIDAAISDLGRRCGGHGLSPEVLRCDEV